MKKNLFNFLLLLTSIVTCVVSCGNTPSTSIPSNPTDFNTSMGPEDGWIGNWDGDGDIIIDEHKCNKCNVCNKCMDLSCDKDNCKDKCATLGDRTKYEFFGVDDNVVKKPGTRGNIVINKKDNYLGEISVNVGASVTYYLEVEKEETVTLLVSIGKSESIDLVSWFNIYINGELYFNKTNHQSDKFSWVEFTDVTLGCATMKAGRNVVEFVVSDGVSQNNFRSLIVYSKQNVLLSDSSHICESKDENGYCNDYTCNDNVCLNKNENGWNSTKILANNEKVLSYSFDKDSLYDSVNDCISIPEGHNNLETILLGLNASEKTYASIYMEVSTKIVNIKLESMFDFYINNNLVKTGSSIDANQGDDNIYVETKVLYLELDSGVNIFKISNKGLNGLNIKSFNVKYEKGNVTLSSIEKPTELTSYLLEAENATLDSEMMIVEDDTASNKKYVRNKTGKNYLGEVTYYIQSEVEQVVILRSKVSTRVTTAPSLKGYFWVYLNGTVLNPDDRYMLHGFDSSIDDGWNNWGTVDISITLKAGTNTLLYDSYFATGFDCIEIIAEKKVSTTVTQIYEAEDANLNDTMMAVEDETASGGYYVRNKTGKNYDGELTFSVNSSKDKDAIMRVVASPRVVKAPAFRSYFFIYVNEELTGNAEEFYLEGANLDVNDSWNNWATVNIPVKLKAGDNKILFDVYYATGIDYIQIITNE